MTFTDEEIFNLRYNINLNKIEVAKRKWTSRLLKTIKRHKVLSFSIISFIFLASFNFMLIYNLIRLLQKI